MPAWPAEQIPELYPPGAAEACNNELKFVEDGLNEVIRKHPNADPAEQRRLVAEWCKANRYSMEERTDKIQVFIASTVAPELDNWVEVTWPKPRDLDSPWSS